MIDIYYSKKGTPYIWASDLHTQLGITTQLRTWFNRMLKYGFEETTEYFRVNKKVRAEKGGTQKVADWAVQLDMAKEIAMIQRTEKGRAIRNYLLNLDKKVSEGLLLNHAQMAALFEICKVMGFVTVQVFFEQQHYAMKEKPRDWWEYRARLLGYTSDDLRDKLDTIGKHYHSQRQALVHLDKYELIRMATMDMFLAMGKSEEYAKNVATFAKSIAQQIQPEIYDDRKASIEFKSEEARLAIETLKEFKTPTKLLANFK